MDEIVLATLLRPEDLQAITASSAEVIGSYPDARLLRCTATQRQSLIDAGVLVSPIGVEAVRVGGSSASLQALAEGAPGESELPADRVAYFIVGLVGPLAPAWRAELDQAGATIHSALPGNALLIGMLPAGAAPLRDRDWVTSVTVYPAGLKVDPRLRSGSAELGAAELAAPVVPAPGLPAGPESAPTHQVEIAVFPGESTADVAARVRAGGGAVLTASTTSVVAVLPVAALTDIAALTGVQAIIPHEFPRFTNDRATTVMDIPVNHSFGTTTLDGSQQLVHVADSGLDTGVAATVHLDIRGRVNTLHSVPAAGLADYAHPPFDDGASDANSGHGTHVTGSVLGNGATAAAAAGAPAVPKGSAPSATVYFSAVEQSINWKTAAELTAAGKAVPNPWPPATVGLYGLPSDLNTLFQPAYAAGARIHTNSWGTTQNVYSGNSADVDKFMSDHRDCLILFAAGNAGADANNDGQIEPGSLGDPGTAKNCVTVGATENNRPHGSTPTPGIDANWNQLVGYSHMNAGHVSDNINGMACFSSRGPTSDGRVKPDVCAPGTNVLSVRSSLAPAPALWGEVTPPTSPLAGKYVWSGGTSMATPLVAGAAALIREYLVDQRHHVQAQLKPSGALLKAFLINGCTTMAGQYANEIPAGRNSVDGFGRVSVAHSIAAVGGHDPQFDDEPTHAVSTGQVRVFDAVVSAAGQPLKVTLAWSDPPSATGVGGLQNRLYLRVQPPAGGTAIDGDVQAFPTATNNSQQVIVPNPVAGTYQIQVHGVAVTIHSPVLPNPATPQQDFALLASNASSLTMVGATSSSSGGTSSSSSGTSSSSGGTSSSSAGGSSSSAAPSSSSGGGSSSSSAGGSSSSSSGGSSSSSGGGVSSSSSSGGGTSSSSSSGGGVSSSSSSGGGVSSSSSSGGGTSSSSSSGGGTSSSSSSGGGTSSSSSSGGGTSSSSSSGGGSSSSSSGGDGSSSSSDGNFAAEPTRKR